MARKKSEYFSEDHRKKMGRRIREIRGFDLTQQDMAKILGIGQGAYSKLEKGKALPTLETLVKLSQHSGKTIDWIVNG